MVRSKRQADAKFAGPSLTAEEWLRQREIVITTIDACIDRRNDPYSTIKVPMKPLGKIRLDVIDEVLAEYVKAGWKVSGPRYRGTVLDVIILS